MLSEGSRAGKSIAAAAGSPVGQAGSHNGEWHGSSSQCNDTWLAGPPSTSRYWRTMKAANPTQQYHCWVGLQMACWLQTPCGTGCGSLHSCSALVGVQSQLRAPSMTRSCLALNTCGISMLRKQGPTCAASLAAVLVQTQTLSCLARTFTTMPQISSPSVNCSPMHASSCSSWQGLVTKVKLGRGLIVLQCTAERDKSCSTIYQQGPYKGVLTAGSCTAPTHKAAA